MYPFYFSHRDGYSRLQTVFAVVVFLIFAATLSYFVSNYLKLHSTEHALENAHTLDTLLAQYANDNNGVYPVGEGTRAPGTSVGIALDLLLNNYTPNAEVFGAGWTPRYSGDGKEYADLDPKNISWDFTAGANGATGITTDAPDLLPVLYTTGAKVTYVPGQAATLSAAGPFGDRGMIVALKSGAADYRPAVNGAVPVFVVPACPVTGTYTPIRP